MIRCLAKKIFIVGLTFLLSDFLHAQNVVPTDTLELEVHFRLDRHELDSSYLNNASVLNTLAGILSESRDRGLLHSVEIQAYASPEGPQGRNDALALARTKAVALWLSRNCGVPADFIKQSSGGVGWSLLRAKVAGSDAVYRDKVLEIMDSTPVWIYDSNGRIVGGRRKSLMDLEGGAVWRDMSIRFFPEVRCCLAVVVREVEAESPDVPAVPEIPEIPAVSEVSETTDSTEHIAPVVIPEEVPDTLAILIPPVSVVGHEIEGSEPEGHPVSIKDSVSVADSVSAVDSLVPTDSLFVNEPVDTSAIFALKTNLLSDLALIPNIGIEFHLGKGWSLAANWHYAWWHSDRIHWYWRTYGGDLAVRKYFGNREKNVLLRGHHLGLYGQIHTYDFELGNMGIMGGEPGGWLGDNFNYGGGLEYGYSFRIARKLNLDLSLGLGYLGGVFHEYKPVDDCYVWQTTKNRHYWGPTKAEVSLVWLIGLDRKNNKKDKEDAR